MLAFVTCDLAAPGTEARINRFATPLDRAYAAQRGRPLRHRQSLAGRALVRLLLERAGSRPGQWHFCREHDGRPVLRSSDRRRQIAVSVSHSRNLVAAAITDLGRIGIDIEYRSATRMTDAISAASFGRREQQAVAAEGRPAFYRLWTLREALAKARGECPELLTDGRDYFPQTPPSGVWRSRIGAHDWLLVHATVAGDYGLSVTFAPHARQDEIELGIC